MRAGHSSVAAVAAKIIAGAFHSLAASVWLVPDPSVRLTILTKVFTITAEHAMQVGHIDLYAQADSENGNAGAGAAVWIHHDGEVPDPEDYDRRLEEAAGEYAPRFRRLDALFADHHPHTIGAHHYLALLGAIPQGQGIGSVLLAHHHPHLQDLGIPAYLEAAGQDSASLYARHGYEPVNDPFPLAADATFYPMLRPARPEEQHAAQAQADRPDARSAGAKSTRDDTSNPNAESGAWTSPGAKQ
jgi:GNAT superfamily N-acetyltransferase